MINDNEIEVASIDTCATKYKETQKNFSTNMPDCYLKAVFEGSFSDSMTNDFNLKKISDTNQAAIERLESEIRQQMTITEKFKGMFSGLFGAIGYGIAFVVCIIVLFILYKIIKPMFDNNDDYNQDYYYEGDYNQSDYDMPLNETPLDPLGETPYDTPPEYSERMKYYKWESFRFAFTKCEFSKLFKWGAYILKANFKMAHSSNLNE